MLAPRSHVRTIARKRPRYICPECRTNALLATSSSEAKKSSSSSSSTKASYQTRSFATFSPRWASLETSQPSVGSFQNIRLGPSPTGQSTSSTKKPQSRTDSVIRNHLRAWSAEHAKKKKQEVEEAQGDSFKLQRLAALPNSLFIEEAGLTNDLPGADEAVVAEVEDFPGTWEDGVLGGDVSYIDPGDLIWWEPGRHTRFARPQLAIYLGHLGYQRTYMLGDGRWLVEKSSGQASPMFKQFASQQEVDQLRKHMPVKPLETQTPDYGLKVPYSFAGDIPSADAEPLIGRFARFIDDMSNWRRENLTILDSLYDCVADDERYTSLSFEQAVTKILGVKYSEAPYAAIFTIYRTLQRNHVSLITIQKKNYYPSATLSITPKKLAKHFDQVRTWAREYQESAASAAMGKNVEAVLQLNPLSAFVSKARRLILKSRALRSPTTTGGLGPSSVQAGVIDGEIVRKDNKEPFSENDKMFLEFLWDCYVREPPPRNSRHLAVASLILRAIGAYPKLRLDANMGRLLLQELGTLPPWYLRSDHNVALELPQGRTSTELTQIYDEADNFCRKSGLTQTGDPYILGDSMHSLRQDFGDLPAYCIDSGETLVREDAVSVEPNAQIPGTYWVHGHSAHPSAFIGPDHIMAQRAKRLTQTIFHHTYVSRMLPDPFSFSLSLSPGSPTLTISTLLTETGEVLDVKVRPMTLRNVIFLSNTAVEHILERPNYEAATLSLGLPGSLTWEGMQPVAPADVEKARKYLPDIQLLHKLMQACEERRRRNVAVVPNWEVHGAMSAQSYVYVFGSKSKEGGLFQSQQFQGDPAIRIKVSRHHFVNRVSEMAQFVTLASLLADLMSESAGKWFKDRKLPACYFGSEYKPGFPPEKLNNTPRGERSEAPTGRFSSTPILHVHKSHDAHLWFSSPLRRYPDLMTQWNVDAYLRAEASGMVPPGGPGDKLELPITKGMVEKFIMEDTPRMYEWAKLLGMAEKRHWFVQALFRAFHFKELELPEVWDFYVSSLVPNRTGPDDTGLRGVLLPFRIYGIVLGSKEGWQKGANEGSYLPVKLELVDLVKGTVTVRVVGPPGQTQTQQGSINLAPKARPKLTEEVEFAFEGIQRKQLGLQSKEGHANAQYNNRIKAEQRGQIPHPKAEEQQYMELS